MELLPNALKQADHCLKVGDWNGAWKWIGSLPASRRNYPDARRIRLAAATRLGWWEIAECLVTSLENESELCTREALGRHFQAKAKHLLQDGDSARAAVAIQALCRVWSEGVAEIHKDPALKKFL